MGLLNREFLTGTQQAEVFLLVAANDGKYSISDIRDRLDIKLATASRHISDMGNGRVLAGAKRQGAGLLMTRPDPMDSRNLRIHLTEAGSRLARQVVDLLQ